MFKTESPRKTLFGDRRDSAESFGSGKTLADFYRKNDSNSNSNRNRIDKENISCNEAQDSNLNNKTDSNSYEHLYASLQQMGVYSGAKDFSPAALTVVQTLLKEVRVAIALQ